MVNPKVSIIIPTYNASTYIEETLESIFNQTFCDYEIIVIDDGSTDNTKDLLEKYAHKITYIYQENSGAPAKPRNVGIQRAKAPYIALFDADDIMLEKKLEIEIDILENNPEVSLVFSNFIILEDNKLSRKSFLEREVLKNTMDSIPKKSCGKRSYIFRRPIYDETLKYNFIGTSTVVARKEDLLEVNLFDTRLIGIEDRDLWLRLSKANKIFAYTNEVLSYYRNLDSGISKQNKTLLSHIDFYKRLYKKEKIKKHRKMIKKRIGSLYFNFGLKLKNEKKYWGSIKKYLKSLKYFPTAKKVKVVTAILKLPAFVLIDLIGSEKGYNYFKRK